MFFDRYEIRIQAFGNVVMEHLSFTDPHLRKIYYKNDICDISTKKKCSDFRTFSICVILIFSKIIFAQDSPIFSWCFLLGVLVSPKINHVGFWGGLDTSPNPQIMNIIIWGLGNTEIGILSYQIEARKTIKLLKVLLKYMFPIFGPPKWP